MNKQVLVIGGVVVVLAAVAYFLLVGNKPAQTNVQPTNTEIQQQTMEEESKATNEAMMEEGVKEVTVTGNTNLRFDTPEIKVKKGDTVRVTFKNAGGMHDFVIDELGVKTKTLKAGEQETVEFVVEEAGSFEYYCSVTGHRAAGMKGSLIVE